MESKHSPLKWEYVLVGAVPGILMGSVGALAATPDDVSVELDTESEENDAEVVTFVPEKELEGLTVASVDDAMSFEDAFAEARRQVGPGGLFVWQGNVYNTYTYEEWEAMSDDAKEEFAFQCLETDIDIPVVDVEYPQEEILVDPLDPMEGHDVEVWNHFVEEDEDGNEISVVEALIDGHEACLYDIDDDGIVDVMVIDQNDNMMPDEDEIYDVRQMNLSMDELVDAYQVPFDDIPPVVYGPPTWEE